MFEFNYVEAGRANLICIKDSGEEPVKRFQNKKQARVFVISEEYDNVIV